MTAWLTQDTHGTSQDFSFLLRVTAQGQAWEVTSPNLLQNVFCPGKWPSNLNLTINHFEEYHRHYDVHMGPFDPTWNAQLSLLGKEWRALIIAPTAGQPCDSLEYEPITNCWRSDTYPGAVHSSYIDRLIRKNQGWKGEWKPCTKYTQIVTPWNCCTELYGPQPYTL